MTANVKSTSSRHPDSLALFEELKAAHANLQSAIDDLDHLTRGPVPGKELLDSVRWRISRASLSRRLLWGKIHCDFAPIADESKRAALRHLQEADIRLLRDSAEHVAKWTTETILDDWPAYCRASERMRLKMIEAVSAEKRILYPILAA